MNFSLENNELLKTKSSLKDYPQLFTKDFKNRIKKSMKVLHFKYLWRAYREAKIVLEKYPQDNLFLKNKK
ncbi:hypothetical protein [Campylobacter cuniculorum]|uniref:hypothetical protein n=1 Tax=Campylobacter cuniculorum TaxID=374106 RepID=UPI0023F17387|nr:hypothetical protein [Campylobacter cuniculorum]